MGLKLVDLLRFSKEITIINDDKKPLLIDDKPVKVFVRIIGDQDLQESYKAARAKSSKMRQILRDKESTEYMSDVKIIEEADRDTHIALVSAARRNQIVNEASANVERPELPKIEDVAIDGDAPTLEEQEKLDKMVLDIEIEYQKAIDTYVDTRLAELKGLLEGTTDDSLRELAIASMVDIKAFEVFISELREQKAYRGIYMDRYFKERAFDDVAEFRSTVTIVKNQLIEEYFALEADPEQLKN